MLKFHHGIETTKQSLAQEKKYERNRRRWQSRRLGLERIWEGFKAWAGALIKRKAEDAKEQSEQLQALERRWAEFQWEQAAQRYQERMQKRYGQIRVLGSTQPVDLDEIFTDVHVLEKPQAFKRFDMGQLHELQREPDRLKAGERTPGIRVVQRRMGHRLYILGKPGAGKTTFLKFLVHLTMQGKLDKLPIFVTLKDWSDSGLDLMAYIIQQFDICRFPQAGDFIEYLLENSGAIVFLDGLDEVRREDQQRGRAIAGLQNFCQKYTETQMVITCRVAATDYSFVDFTYLKMADFEDSQVVTYAHKWFSQDEEKANQFIEELKKPDNKGLRDLGRSPLLLSLICLAYDETYHIPQRRVELYEEALDALLKKWDANRKIRRDEASEKLSLGRKKQMFARIAAASFIKGEIFFSKRHLSGQISKYLKKPAARRCRG